MFRDLHRFAPVLCVCILTSSLVFLGGSRVCQLVDLWILGPFFGFSFFFFCLILVFVFSYFILLYLKKKKRTCPYRQLSRKTGITLQIAGNETVTACEFVIRYILTLWKGTMCSSMLLTHFIQDTPYAEDCLN